MKLKEGYNFLRQKTTEFRTFFILPIVIIGIGILFLISEVMGLYFADFLGGSTTGLGIAFIILVFKNKEIKERLENKKGEQNSKKKEENII